MKALIAVLPGDGIGPEVVAEGIRVLEAVARKGGHTFETREALVGGIAIDRTGTPLSDDTLALCQQADAVLFGAIGGPKWDDPHAKVRPERALLRLRKELGLFANLRPVGLYPSLKGASPLKAELLEGVDMLVVRELTGGIYFGEKTRTVDRAVDTCTYTVDEVVRITRVACEAARGRRKKVTSVDKANILETSRLWRATVERVVHEEYPDLALDHLLVDAAAMHLIQRPAIFDVILTENMFGDILSDEASVLSGSMGLLPSASLGEGRRGLYEPIHGTAPTLAGKGIANPYATILSAALLLRHSLGLEHEARAVEGAVAAAIERGVLTEDLVVRGRPAATTAEAGRAVLDALANAWR
jgi:3-isopropylmalate dehydrogenase